MAVLKGTVISKRIIPREYIYMLSIHEDQDRVVIEINEVTYICLLVVTSVTPRPYLRSHVECRANASGKAWVDAAVGVFL